MSCLYLFKKKHRKRFALKVNELNVNSIISPLNAKSKNATFTVAFVHLQRIFAQSIHEKPVGDF